MARLYHVPLSPFCRKVRLSLAEKRIEVELVEERYWEKEADFLRRNPAAKVPVIRLDGKLMAESAAICEYLEETRPEPSLMPSDPDGRYEVRRLVNWFDDKFHNEVTSKLLYERVNIPTAATLRPARGRSNIISTIWRGCSITDAGWRGIR
jgi:glutathione S-transferase